MTKKTKLAVFHSEAGYDWATPAAHICA